jgi:hypothetical protein
MIAAQLLGQPAKIEPYTIIIMVKGEFQPPPCAIDWPPGSQDQPVAVKKYSIHHCQNLVCFQLVFDTYSMHDNWCNEFQNEGIYDVSMAAFNPLDGWISSNPLTIEVLAPIGPFKIDDFLIVSDNVLVTKAKLSYYTK